MTLYRVTHCTSYRYEQPVEASYGQMHLLPRSGKGQTCRTSRVVIDPTPDDLRERVDFFGNRAAFYAIHAEHTRLTVTTTSDVEVNRGDPGPSDAPPWEEVRDRTTAPGANGWEPTDFLLDSPLVVASVALADYAAPSFTPGRPVLEALLDLARRINADFDYEPGSTSVTTTVEDLLTARKGVCQDFAHLAIGCLRSLGLAARYVSGYLETVPPRERSGSRAPTSPTPGRRCGSPTAAGSTSTPPTASSSTTGTSPPPGAGTTPTSRPSRE